MQNPVGGAAPWRGAPWVSLCVAVACVFGAAGGCGGSGAQHAAGVVVPVDLANFKIAGAARVRAGLVTFALNGVGPTMHEFNVARTDDAPSALPLAANGTVDDHTLHAGFELIAEREGVDIGDHASLSVQLRPGHYVVYCNMYGHYEAGMHAELLVS